MLLHFLESKQGQIFLGKDSHASSGRTLAGKASAAASLTTE